MITLDPMPGDISDYVVRAFNKDKPYNHFVKEQLGRG